MRRAHPGGIALGGNSLYDALLPPQFGSHVLRGGSKSQVAEKNKKLVFLP